MDLGTILSVWAHPDDETYLAGGVMADATDRGQRVVCISLTAGEHGTSDPVGWPPSRLARVRTWEAAAAMAVLGVCDHRMLGLPDGAVSVHEEIGVAAVVDLIDEVRPDTILTFGPDGVTFHPDHIAVHRIVTRAWEHDGRRARLLYATPTVEHLAEFGSLYDELGVYMTDARPEGATADEIALHLALEDAALDRKLTALRALASQTSGVIRTLDLGAYSAQIAEEAFVDADTLSSPWSFPATPHALVGDLSSPD